MDRESWRYAPVTGINTQHSEIAGVDGRSYEARINLYTFEIEYPSLGCSGYLFPSSPVLGTYTERITEGHCDDGGTFKTSPILEEARDVVHVQYVAPTGWYTSTGTLTR